jgi:NADH-quinone oxidoreductase subunit C
MSETPQPAAPAAPPVSPIKTEVDRIRAAQSDAILSVEEQPERGMFWINVKPRSIVAVAKLLRDDKALDYKMLSDLFALDRPDEEKRFNILYNFYSISRNRRVFVRVRVAEHEPVPTLSEVYASANYPEREIYDLFGVHFEGHPNLTRIMMPDDWDGHPLRKDYPIVGKRPVILFNDVKDIL